MKKHMFEKVLLTFFIFKVKLPISLREGVGSVGGSPPSTLLTSNFTFRSGPSHPAVVHSPLLGGAVLC